MLPGPQVIQIVQKPKFGRRFTHEPVPILMHLCSATRKEVLKSYKPMFEQQSKRTTRAVSSRNALSEVNVTMDPSKDVLYFRPDVDWQYCGLIQNDRANIGSTCVLRRDE